MNFARPKTPTEWSTWVWNDETGETWGEAFARFETFGEVFDAAHAVLLDPDTEVMSFGYGDDPEDFDGINVSELREALAQGDTLDDLDFQWGPFALWTNA